LGVLFLLGWSTEAAAEAPEAFISLFVRAILNAPPQALAEGLVWAVVAGGLLGALAAICFNRLTQIGRRSAEQRRTPTG
jgi:hypothetical protein